MAETVTLPAIGTVKTSYVWAGIALVGGIAGYAWWRARSNASTPAVVDPTLATNSGTSTYTNPVPGNANGSGQSDTGSAPTTDAQWTQLALTTITWLDAAYLANVLGKYLAGQPLTTDEADVVRQVWGVIGKPPGNQRIILVTSGGGSPGGTPSGDGRDTRPGVWVTTTASGAYHTLPGIAHGAYGPGEAASAWWLILSANTPDKIRPDGTKGMITLAQANNLPAGLHLFIPTSGF